jgi:hypothetical protein
MSKCYSGRESADVPQPDGQPVVLPRMRVHIQGLDRHVPSRGRATPAHGRLHLPPLLQDCAQPERAPGPLYTQTQAES